MTPTDLHTKVHATITTRLELARAATSGDWYVHEEPVDGETWTMYWVHSTTCGAVIHDMDHQSCGVGIERLSDEGGRADADHIAANDPAAIIRACEADLERLAEHSLTAPYTDPLRGEVDPWTSARVCRVCDPDDCVELLRMARVYNITIEPDEPDERAAVSHQWAPDWDNPDDTTYDQTQPPEGG